MPRAYFNAKKVTKKPAAKKKKATKRQGYKSREDESLGMRRGKASSKTQSYKYRRDEAQGVSDSIENNIKDKYSLNIVSILVRVIYQSREF